MTNDTTTVETTTTDAVEAPAKRKPGRPAHTPEQKREARKAHIAKQKLAKALAGEPIFTGPGRPSPERIAAGLAEAARIREEHEAAQAKEQAKREAAEAKIAKREAAEAERVAKREAADAARRSTVEGRRLIAANDILALADGIKPRGKVDADALAKIVEQATYIKRTAARATAK